MGLKISLSPGLRVLTFDQSGFDKQVILRELKIGCVKDMQLRVTKRITTTMIVSRFHNGSFLESSRSCPWCSLFDADFPCPNQGTRRRIRR